VLLLGGVPGKKWDKSLYPLGGMMENGISSNLIENWFIASCPSCGR